LSATRALAALLQLVWVPPSREIVAVVTEVAIMAPVAPVGEQPQRFATPPPPHHCGAAQLFGHVIVVEQAVTVPHHDGSQLHPHRFAPPPPQV